LLVSVLTATFNRRATFLPQCLDSVRHQVGDGFTPEHIVGDDCSADGTWDYLQQAAREDPRVKPVRTQATRMTAHAQNCGLAAATGGADRPVRRR
jgi:glycosyltransferase involved in cell wall biosynthesis